MKIRTFIALSVLLIVVGGCSREVQHDSKELGSDLKRDVNQAAREVDAKVDDAVN